MPEVYRNQNPFPAPEVSKNRDRWEVEVHAIGRALMAAGHLMVSKGVTWVSMDASPALYNQYGELVREGRRNGWTTT